jgi:5-methyltetrahydrofolate--homocysteine methyltransferase
MFKEWLKDDSKIILFDGAMGTEIIKRGIASGKLPDYYNIEHPDIIKEIHAAYYAAGSDMCQTNTFGSNLLNLKQHKLEHELENINKAALENIKDTCTEGRLIVGDIGPSGTFRAPVGKATFDSWKEGFLTQVRVLERGVDLWHVETISDIEEMVAAIKAIKQVSSKPIISSITYKRTKRGFFTIMGDSLEKCIQVQEREQVDVVGSNCTLGSNEMIELSLEMVKLTNKPISIKPNAGKPKLVAFNKTVYDQTPQDFAKDAKKIVDNGTKIIGGCCGTSPDTIIEIKRIIQ